MYKSAVHLTCAMFSTLPVDCTPTEFSDADLLVSVLISVCYTGSFGPQHFVTSERRRFVKRSYRCNEPLVTWGQTWLFDLDTCVATRDRSNWGEIIYGWNAITVPWQQRERWLPIWSAPIHEIYKQIYLKRLQLFNCCSATKFMYEALQIEQNSPKGNTTRSERWISL